MDFTGLFNALEVRLHELLKARVRSPSLFHESDLVTKTETVLKEKRAAYALYSTLAHDANTITQNICLVHVMCGEDNNSVFLVRLEHIPKVSSSAEVHSRGGLVK